MSPPLQKPDDPNPQRITYADGMEFEVKTEKVEDGQIRIEGTLRIPADTMNAWVAKARALIASGDLEWESTFDDKGHIIETSLVPRRRRLPRPPE